MKIPNNLDIIKEIEEIQAQGDIQPKTKPSGIFKSNNTFKPRN